MSASPKPTGAGTPLADVDRHDHGRAGPGARQPGHRLPAGSASRRWTGRSATTGVPDGDACEPASEVRCVDEHDASAATVTIATATARKRWFDHRESERFDSTKSVVSSGAVVGQSATGGSSTSVARGSSMVESDAVRPL